MKGNEYNWKLPDAKTLESLYCADKMSSLAIAQKYRVTKAAVRHKLKRHEINLRSMSESQTLIANYISLTSSALAFIDGLLLGDGCIFPSPRGLSAQYKHSDKNPDYIVWLANQLSDMGIEIETRDYPKVSKLASKWYRDFMIIRERWYPLGKKQVPPDIKLEPVTLMNWYIGDGNYHIPAGDGGGEQVTIAMQYDELGKNLLRTKLYELGIATTSYKDCIYFRSSSRQHFFTYMIKVNITIPECYKYKFPRRYYHANEQS